jgi:hypothetical protein
MLTIPQIQAKVEEYILTDKEHTISVSQTSYGLWVARVEYPDEFYIVEGKDEKVLQIRGPFRPARYRPLGEFNQDSARDKVAAYRAAPKLTLAEERRLEFEEDFGLESSIDRTVETRES